MGPVRERLREFRDGEPVGIGAAVEVVALLAVAAVSVAFDLDAETVSTLVVGAGVLAVVVARWQRNNAIPYPKVRRTGDDEQADRDEFADPADPI